MRVIEHQMISAIKQKKNWKNNNTRVEVIESGIQYTPGFSRTINVYLHGHRIATLVDDLSVVVNSCGWRTTTTKSRLNAILREFTNNGIYQSKFEWYLNNGEEFEDNAVIPMVG
jgi:hypothetical protein